MKPVQVSTELVKALKIMAAEQDTTIKQLVEDALTVYIDNAKTLTSKRS